MKPKTRIPDVDKIAPPRDGKTRPPDAPLDKETADSFKEVEPAGFGDHPRSSIEAAAVDPDVADSEGGE